MEMRTPEVGLLKIGSLGRRTIEISREQISVAEIRSVHISPAEVRADENGATKIEVGETQTRQILMTQYRTRTIPHVTGILLVQPDRGHEFRRCHLNDPRLALFGDPYRYCLFKLAQLPRSPPLRRVVTFPSPIKGICLLILAI